LFVFTILTEKRLVLNEQVAHENRLVFLILNEQVAYENRLVSESVGRP
jgi:hypothetical protein